MTFWEVSGVVIGSSCLIVLGGYHIFCFCRREYRDY